MKTIIWTLRTKGYKIRVVHKRAHVKDKFKKHPKEFYHRSEFKDANEIWPKGGSTTIDITTLDNKEFSQTVYCSMEDCFNRKVGINIAIGRILKDANIEI